jgi:hypothetical protein
MPHEWSECIIEGNKLYNYMIHHINEMFDETSISNFYIGYSTKLVHGYYDDIVKKYGNIVYDKLIPWIKNELEEKRLFDHTNWKPSVDCDSFNSIYLGYNRLLQYNQYYFQLIIDSGCNCDECIPDNKCGYPPHFELLLYGWKENGSEKLQPDNQFVLINDIIIPMEYW